MTFAIEVAHLNHAYINGHSRTQVLSDVSMHVQVGETVALIGRSGSGKSTLLNLISGLEPISDGDVALNGTSIKGMNDHKRTLLRGRQVGFIYQAFNLIPTLTVFDNVSLPLSLSGTSSKQHAKRIHELLSAISLENRHNDYPDRLSGGEQQRVAIARALAHSPSLILADEPTGNLDAVNGRQVMQLLSELVNQQQAAMLLVTHSMEVARNANRVLMLDQGRIREITDELPTDGATW
jgi:putative ABC transport system ATP-binding protein